jgi:hypothetical protein
MGSPPSAVLALDEWHAHRYWIVKLDEALQTSSSWRSHLVFHFAKMVAKSALEFFRK